MMPESKPTSSSVNLQSRIVDGTPCSVQQVSDGTCAAKSSWAQIEVAERATIAAERTVDLGFAGLIIGTLTLAGAFYAAWQAKRGADAALHDARSNAAAAKELADDRDRQLAAQVRLHEAKFTFPDCTLTLGDAKSMSLRILMENNGETAAIIRSAQFGITASLGEKKMQIVGRREFEIPDSSTILPGEQRQIVANHLFDPN